MMQASLSKAFLRGLILQHTRLSSKHLTPELNFHLITPACHLWKAGLDQSPFDDPFWAFYWPGGQALTRFILDNPAMFQGRRVLDVGSGCGSASIACALSGAVEVVANDIDPVSEVATEMNMEVNRVTKAVKPDNRNYLATPPTSGLGLKAFDIILMGDMFYDPDFTQLISDWLSGIHQTHDTKVLIGDPGRLPFMQHPLKNRLTRVAQYALDRTCQLENRGLTEASVWMFERPG